MVDCPCGSGLEFAACCEPVLAGAPASGAEALLRARYTALVRKNVDFIVDTLAPEVRGEFDKSEAEKNFQDVVWDGLEVRAPEPGADGDRVVIEFLARYRHRGERRVHHEKAKFRRDGDGWICEGGEVNPKGPPLKSDKVGRNDPCPCGSGKKYKKCCGA